MSYRISVLIPPLLVVACASSQAAPEHSGQTLRYRESTDSEYLLSTPQGNITIEGDHEAVITWAPVRGDSIHAWYETVTVSSTDPRGVRQPDLSSVVGKPFVLRLDASGRIETLQTPTFPESLEGVSDLRKQFADFFPRRPTVPLRVGATWQDTIVTTEDEDGTRSSTRKNAHYEVVADTISGGISAWLVASRSEITVMSSGPVEGQPGVRAEVQMEGVETGTFTLSRSDGVMITRERVAELSGTMTYRAGSQSTQIGSKQSYVSTIELVQR